MFQILINCFGWGEILKHLYIIKSKILLNMRVEIYFLNLLLYMYYHRNCGDYLYIYG